MPGPTGRIAGKEWNRLHPTAKGMAMPPELPVRSSVDWLWLGSLIPHRDRFYGAAICTFVGSGRRAGPLYRLARSRPKENPGDPPIPSRATVDFACGVLDQSIVTYKISPAAMETRYLPLILLPDGADAISPVTPLAFLTRLVRRQPGMGGSTRFRGLPYLSKLPTRLRAPRQNRD